jgi:tyrosine-protein kinase Etk/Wzc
MYTILNNEMKIIDLIKIFNKYKRYILIIPLSIGIIVSFLLLFVVDEIFISVGTVKTTTKSSGLSSVIGQSLPDLGDIGDLTGSSSSSKELALYENILSSRRCIEEIVTKFNLMQEWKIKFMQDAVKNFRENCLYIKKDKIAGTMEIGFYDKYPQRAKDITDYLILQLNKINIELNVQNAKANREFIEKRYYEIKNELKKSEDSLKNYQDIYGIAPEAQTKVVATTEIQMEAELKSEEVKLDLLKKMLSPDQSEIKMQEEKINLLKKQVEDIKNSNNFSNGLTLKGKPGIVLNYLRLVRNVEIQNKLLIYLMPLYEQAKIEEKKEMPIVLVIDSPNLPERKVKPKRTIIVLSSVFFFAILTFFFFVLIEKWKIYKQMLKQS